jgi:hypothetical protein
MEHAVHQWDRSALMEPENTLEINKNYVQYNMLKERRCHCHIYAGVEKCSSY